MTKSSKVDLIAACEEESVGPTSAVHSHRYSEKKNCFLRNDKKCQSDGNCLHVRRKQFFFSLYLWEWTAEMGPTLSSSQPAIRSTFDDLVTWCIQNCRFYPTSATDFSLFYRL